MKCIKSAPSGWWVAFVPHVCNDHKSSQSVTYNQVQNTCACTQTSTHVYSLQSKTALRCVRTKCRKAKTRIAVHPTLIATAAAPSATLADPGATAAHVLEVNLGCHHWHMLVWLRYVVRVALVAADDRHIKLHPQQLHRLAGQLRDVKDDVKPPVI